MRTRRRGDKKTGGGLDLTSGASLLKGGETGPAVVPNTNDPKYLAADMQARLAKDEFRFRFMVQFQTDAATMPLDRSTVRWSETVSPPIEIGTLVIPAQDILARGQPRRDRGRSAGAGR